MAKNFNDNGIEEYDSWVTPEDDGATGDTDLDALLARALAPEDEETGEQEELFADEAAEEGADGEGDGDDEDVHIIDRNNY